MTRSNPLIRRSGTIRGFISAANSMYRYCRVGHGYPCGRLYSLRAGIRWGWKYR